MKYQFQSQLRNLQIQGVGEFKDFLFETDSEEVAARLKKNSGFNINIWEVIGESPDSPVPKRKPGRPPKVRVVTGMRTSEVNERDEE